MAQLYDFPYDKQETPPDVLPEPKHPAGNALRRFGKRGRLDVPFFLLTLLLLAVGLVMLLSASYADAYYETVGGDGPANPMYYFTRQLLFAIGGVGAMLVMSFIPLSFIRNLSIPALLVSAALLLVVKLTGLTGNGAVRWIAIGGITFQPSELMKAAVVLAFSDWIARQGDRMQSNRSLPIFLITLAVFAVLLLMQPHLSATIILLLLGALMLFAGGTKWYWFAAAAGLVAIAVILVRGNAEQVVAKIAEMPASGIKYQLNRISAWLDPESQKLADGWQILQSLYAIGSGGLLGLGLGNSRQKYLYLPEEQNDYIFPIICEELGFVGATLILLLFAVLILRGFWLAIQSKDPFERMMIIGFTGLLFIQVFLNVGVVTNLLPSTGISLPFFSYGGTALLVQLAEVGIILSASRNIENK